MLRPVFNPDTHSRPTPTPDSPDSRRAARRCPGVSVACTPTADRPPPVTHLTTPTANRPPPPTHLEPMPWCLRSPYTHRPPHPRLTSHSRRASRRCPGVSVARTPTADRPPPRPIRAPSDNTTASLPRAACWPRCRESPDSPATQPQSRFNIHVHW